MSLDGNQCYASDVGFQPGFTIETTAMLQRHAALRFTHPLPYGAILHDGGVQFVVFSRSATAMRVLLYDKASDPEPAEIVHFDPDLNRWGDIWSVFVPGIGAGQLYHYQADGPHEPSRGQRFDPQARLIDPYCKALAGDFLPAVGGIVRPPKCVVIHDKFDWQGDRHLRRNLSETIIYEMHVRGFTNAASSGVKHPGTYLGVDREDSLLEIAGRHCGRVDAGPRVPDPRLPGTAAAAGELLGLRPDGPVLAAPRLRRGKHAGVPGPRVQGNGPGAARRGHRGHPRRRLQPHGRRQRARVRR